MEVNYYIFNNLPETEQQQIASLLEQYTNGQLGESPQMLPVSGEDIMNKYVGVVAMIDTTYAGYVGATLPESNGPLLMSEVGSLWVPAEYRKQKIAYGLVSVASKFLSLTGIMPYVFCNPLSIGVFKHASYEVVTPSEVPQSAFCACAICPKKPEQGCCDTVLVYKGGQDVA